MRAVHGLVCPPFAGTLPASPELAVALADVLARRRRRQMDGARRAAVLALVYARGDEPHLLLTRRADTLARHPGQVSLPGGRPEPGDADLAATALRETHEEVGVPPAAIRILGALDDVHTMASAFVISPYVGLVDPTPQPVANDAEIGRIFEISLRDLLDHDAGLPSAPTLGELRYALAGEDIWGATARILRNLAAVIRCALADRPRR